MPKKLPALDGSKVRFGVSPPVRPQPGYDILSPRPDGEVRAIILSDAVLGVMVHFLSPRTSPCIGPENSCLGCERQIPARWKGYVCGYHIATQRKVIIELTHGCVLDPRHAAQFAGQQLRGLEIIMWRKSKARNAAVICKLQSPGTTLSPLPRPFDLEAALLTIWEGKRPDGWTPASNGEQHEPSSIIV